MKKVLLGIGLILTGSAVALTLTAANYEPKVRPNTYVGLVSVGGLSKDQAAFKIRQWWEQEKSRELEFSLPVAEPLRGVRDRKTIKGRPSQLGLAVDDQASVAQLPLHDFWENASNAISSEGKRSDFEIKFKQSEDKFEKIAKFVEDSVGDHKPARVIYSAGAFQRIPEQSGHELDTQRMPEIVLAALKGDGRAELPIHNAPKKVEDDKLALISEVVSQYSTRFSTGKSSRTANIRLAASKINGLVLAPKEKFSFNGVVGRRTTKAGFKVAGVYKNGKHDIDVGGGICQVSSTLYNAVLFANLKVKSRQNHSMPVPYVPIGRDATVDYGSVDFAFENSFDFPIAINTEVVGGTITFRILGQKDPSLQVKVVSSGAKSWATGEKTVVDPSIPAGKRRVIEKGSAGHSVNTFRVVYKDGQEVNREPLGKSHYRGGVRIVAIGAKPIAKPTTEVATTAPKTGGDDGLPPIDDHLDG